MMTVDPGVDPMATGLDYNDYRGAAYAFEEYSTQLHGLGEKQ